MEIVVSFFVGFYDGYDCPAEATPLAPSAVLRLRQVFHSALAASINWDGYCDRAAALLLCIHYLTIVIRTMSRFCRERERLKHSCAWATRS